MKPETRWPILLALVLMGVCALRVALSHWVPSPYILTDELLYTKLARSLVEHHATLFRGAVMNFPAVLYPLLLVPAYLAPDPELSFRLAQVTNALLMTSAGVPVALLARRMLDERAAIPVMLLVMAAPFTLYSNVAMSENAFFPLVMWTAYLTLRSLETERPGTKAALGLVLGLAFLTKPQGLLLPAGVGAAFVAAVTPGQRQQRVTAFWPTATVFAIFLLLHVVKTNLLMGSPLWSVWGFFGSYAGGFSSAHPFVVSRFLASVLANLGAIAISVAVAPAVLYVGFLALAVRQGSLADRVLAAFSLTLGLLLVAVTARHTVTLDDPSRIHERYCFHVAPLVLIGGLRALQLTDWRQKIWLVATGILALVAPWAAAMASPTPYVADTLSLTLLSGLIEKLGLTKGLAVAVPFMLASSLVIGGLLLRRLWKVATLVGLGYSVMLSGGATYAQHHSSGTHAALLPLVRWVTQHVPDSEPLALLATKDQFKNCLVVEFYTRLPNYLFYEGVAPIHGANDLPVELNSNGELGGLSRLPDGAYLLVPKSIRLTSPALGQFEDLVLYKKWGTVKLRDRLLGLQEDGWTTGKCLFASPGSGHPVEQIELSVDTTGIPARLSPLPITVIDPTGRQMRFMVPVGRQEKLRFMWPRAGRQGLSLAICSPTWSPATDGGSNDRRSLGFKLTGAALIE